MAVTAEPVFETDLQGLELIHRGKVRDMYAVGDEHMLIVVSDRLSAFDVVLPDPIPGKGAVLTELSNFWFWRTVKLVANHLSTLRLEDVLTDADERARMVARAVLVQRLEPLPVEAIQPGMVIFDTVYNPIETKMLRDAQQAGCKTVDGVAMFVNQAVAQFEAWTNHKAPIDMMRRVVLDHLGT